MAISADVAGGTRAGGESSMQSLDRVLVAPNLHTLISLSSAF